MEWELQPERRSREGLGRGHAKAFGFIWKTPCWMEVASDPPPLPTPWHVGACSGPKWWLLSKKQAGGCGPSFH